MTRSSAGIDLGTTNTVLAVWRHGEPKPELVPIHQPIHDLPPNGLRAQLLLDSVVTLLDGKAYVGAYARQLALWPKAHTYSSIKRFMGRHWFRTYGGGCWTPERVSACILKVVRQELISRFGGEPERLVVTIPASFGTEARAATVEAACLAGFNPSTLSLFDEPTAALLAEFKGGTEIQAAEGKRHAVIDIGGGTLDVSLVHLRRDDGEIIFDVVGQSRYNEIAGDDFDFNIAGLLLDRFEKQVEPISTLFNPQEKQIFYWLLLREARDVKHRLSTVLADQPYRLWPSICESVSINLQKDNLPTWRTEVSGRDLVDALRQYFGKGDDPDERRSTFGIYGPIQECLDTAAIHEGYELDLATDVKQLWITGGSAKLPTIAWALQHIFKREPRLIRKPMYAVALGAAWKAGVDAGYGKKSFQVRERMHDGIFLKTSQTTFHSLVPLRQAVPMRPVWHHHLLRMPLKDKRLAVELYTGRQPTEDNHPCDLSPLAQRIVKFDEILPDNTDISVSVELTADRRLILEFTANLAPPITGVVSLGPASNGEASTAPSPLPPINQP